MNKKKQKQEKLHDSLINMLYTPPSPPPLNQTQFDEKTLNLARQIINSDHHHHINTDELEEVQERGLSEEEDDGELGFQKLTRAQRKNLRKKKLKQAVSERRRIVGPELPDCSEGVRRNATERLESGNDNNYSKTSHTLLTNIVKSDSGGETSSCIKVKHRRMSKKKAVEKPKIHSSDVSHDDQN